MIPITLACCTCGDTITFECSKTPEFSFEFYDIVKKAGWVPALDLNHGRTLCFCSAECKDKQITKGGYFRKKLIKVQKPKGDKR